MASSFPHSHIPHTAMNGQPRSHPIIETETIELDDPDLEKAERDREERTRETMTVREMIRED